MRSRPQHPPGLSALLGCPRPTTDAVDVLVLAPHPDDEVLLAGGVMEQAVRTGQRVHVVLMTNGDYTCERDGYLREAESVAALKLLGVPEKNVHFLGYPDGALSQLGTAPHAPLEHRDATGQCVARTGTYADRAAGRLDEHTQRTGAPAEWTAENLTGDLEALLRRLQPRHVYLPHGIDDHPDHAMTYVFFRRALDRLEGAPPLVHRGIVHRGACWPSDCKSVFAAPALPLPPLPAPLEGYAFTERVPIDGAKKLEAIQRYGSQFSPWLSSFARADEGFWPERYVRKASRWERLTTPGPYEETERWGPAGYEGIAVAPRIE